MSISQVIKKQQLRYYKKHFRIVKNNPRFKKIWKYLKEKNIKGKLLDIGCGDGGFCDPLLGLGYECYGLDLTAVEFKKARERGIKVTKANFLQGLPYEDKFFDIVFAGEVVEHSIDDLKFLQECYRILKPNGLLILTTPNLVSLGNRLLSFLGLMPRFAYNEFHYRIYNLPLIKKKLKATGFKIKKTSSSHVLISTVFNKYLGVLGEGLGASFPTLGEQLIIFAKKKSLQKKIEVLMSPAHYYLDDKKIGSESSWVTSIIKGIAQAKKYYLSIITGYIKNLSWDNNDGRIYEIYHSENNNLSIFNALYFTLKKTFKSKILGRKKNFQIVHHLLPFGLGTTFDLDFIFKDKNKKYVIGPIQSAQVAAVDEEFTFDRIGFKIAFWQKLLRLMDNYIVILFQGITNYLCNLTLKKADKNIVINYYTKKILLKRGVAADKIVIIPPGIDTEKFKYIPLEKKNSKIIEIISCGWLIKRKGVELIIKAMAEIIKVDKNIRLRIVGDGPQKENLMNLVKELNLQDYIIFEGFIPHHKIQKYYEQAHIFVSMSRSESWGQMYTEAMAAGLPIIAAKNNGSKKIVKDRKFGYLIAQEDCRALKHKLITLIKNKDLINKFGKKAREEAQKKYDWRTVIIPKYLEIYKKLTSSYGQD